MLSIKLLNSIDKSESVALQTSVRTMCSRRAMTWRKAVRGIPVRKIYPARRMFLQ